MSATAATEFPKLLSFAEVLQRVPYSRVWIEKLVKRGEFPAPIRLGPNRIAFEEPALLDWLDQRKADTTAGCQMARGGA